MGYLLPARGDAVRGRQTQNPERGRKHVRRRRKCPTARVVRPKTPRGDGNLRQPFRCDADGRLGSSDPKPREGTETFARVPVSVVNRQSSDPKPREGTETFARVPVSVVNRQSSDPKPREGTETRQQSRRPARMTPVVRPKTPRGDGNWIALTGLALILVVVRPKTPRGDGNWIALTGLALILVVVRPKTPRGDGNSTSISLTSPGEKITSSDPKPRERTETRRRSRRCRCPNRRVVRPKTPRGDGNLERVTADGTIETSRQTQNPERGRKPSAQHR
ncbi:hypothetical protein AO49_04077 [Mycobacterium tuberculosis M1913]|nr:hypothetical protein AO49_04077 [Mycobacterium tuberculosis M1913]